MITHTTFKFLFKGVFVRLLLNNSTAFSAYAFLLPYLCCLKNESKTRLKINNFPLTDSIYSVTCLTYNMCRKLLP